MLKGKLSKGLGIYIIIGLMIVGLSIGVGAKYITQKIESNLFVAKDFYFVSDLLVEGGAEYTLNPGVTSVSFTLANNEDSLHVSPGNISYTVDSNGGSLSSSGGTLQGAVASSTSITLSGMTNGGTYTVTAAADGDYNKTISATFKVRTDEPIVYKHVDATDPAFVILTVWTDNISGNASIGWNKAGLIPDNTDPVMSSVSNYNTSTSTYDPSSFTDTGSFTSTYSSKSYRFFKDGSVSCTAENFDVIVNGTSAILGTL